MAEGKDSWNGLALPLNGSYEQKQTNVAEDMVTLTGKLSQTGDFIVCQGSTGTEYFVVSSAGALTVGSTLAVGGNLTVTGNRIKMGSALTTAPTTGLTKGDIFVIFGGSTATAPQIGVCISTATNELKYFGGLTHTLGRQT